MKRILCSLLCVLLLCGQAFAADDDSLQTQIDEFMAESGLDETNFSMSYFNLVTGETYAFNDGAFLPVGTVWTLPLHMHFYEQESLGAFDPPPEEPEKVYTVGGMTLEDCRYHSILLGEQEISQKMCEELGTLAHYQQLVNEEFGHIQESKLPEKYLTNLCYSAEFLMNCLMEIAAYPDSFGTLMKNYSLAQKENGFAAYGRPYELTHILGEEDGMLCDVGRVSAPQPYLLVCFVPVEGGEELLAQLNALVCCYVEGASAAAASGEETHSTGRSESDYTVTGTNPNDHTEVVLWIGIALGAAAGLALILVLIFRLVRRRRDRDSDEW